MSKEEIKVEHKLLKIEAGLKNLGLDANILNYVKIACINMVEAHPSNDMTSSYKIFMSNINWKKVVSALDFKSYKTCVCGKAGLVRLYAIVHKKNIHDINEDNILIIGSDCIKRVIYYANSLNMAHTFGDINCSTLFTNKCGIRSSTGLRNIKPELVDYYSQSTLWNYTHVCHNCEPVFKKILMSCKPGSDDAKTSIYACLKTNYGKKQLRNFIQFLKMKNLQVEDKWREWCIVANVCLEASKN